MAMTLTRNPITDALATLLENTTQAVSSRWKKYDIKKTVDGEEQIYLRRYFIWRSRWFNIYLHEILMPDLDPDPHDHPWSFVSLLLRGAYTERRWGGKKSWYEFRSAPGIATRAGHCIHQITDVDPGTWSLVFTGPRNREWGFVTPVGWVHWRKYLGMPDKSHSTEPEID